MIPGMNMNSRQMKMAMQKMGMRQEDLDAVKVTIELSDKKLVFDSPQVAKVNMMGSASFQIVGEAREESLDTIPDINEDDVKTVMDQTDATEEEARKAIEDSNGDLAEAILSLQDSE